MEQPNEVYVEVAVPEPRKECRTITTELTEVVCKDVSRWVQYDQFILIYLLINLL